LKKCIQVCFNLCGKTFDLRKLAYVKRHEQITSTIVFITIVVIAALVSDGGRGEVIVIAVAVPSILPIETRNVAIVRAINNLDIDFRR